MEQLRLTGVSEDGRYLLLVDDSGSAYRLPRDERVAAAVRRDTARLGQLEIELDSQLRPREIQARIRAGQTAEEVAAAAGVPLEKVRRYEGPVLAEREYIAAQARAMPVRRPGADERPPALEVAVERTLEAHGAATDGLGWDAWRREDGRWTIRLTFRHGNRERLATWVYELSGRVLHAEDDEARWLCGLEPLPIERSGHDGERPARRLSSVPAPEPVPAAVLDVEQLIDVRQSARAARPADAPDPAPEPAAAAEPHDAEEAATAEEQQPAVRPAQRQAARAGRRAAVPSWDEIVFGSRRRD